MKNRVMLDGDALTSIFCNTKFCQGVKSTRIPMQMQTNSGNILASKSYRIPKLGEAYFNKKGMTNIIGLSQMRRRYQVTYNSEKEPTFFIYMDEKIVKFPEINDGLYAPNMEGNKHYKKRKIW